MNLSTTHSFVSFLVDYLLFIFVRQRELSINQFDTLDELEDFAENSQSSLLYVLLHVLKLSDPQADEDLAHAASHVGVCTGIVTLLRSIAYHAAQVRICVSHFLTSTCPFEIVI